MKLVDKGTCTITFCYFYGKKKNLILKISSYLKKKTKYNFFLRSIQDNTFTVPKNDV